ncbi:hypothetical protein BX616_009204, partial [Lobosporangium transversale]
GEAVTKGAILTIGGVAYGAFQKVDGVLKRTVQVLTTRKAKVDEVAPIAKHSFVYYDDEVYDCVLTENGTDKKYVIQLLFDSKQKVYYVYYRWNETEYTLDGPHEDVDRAKEAFKVTYTQKFGIEWKDRENAVSDRFTYVHQIYETYEEVEEVEEIVEEKDVEVTVVEERQAVIEGIP